MSLERLAILGGPPAFDPPVRLYGPPVSDAERLAPEIARVVETGVLTKGPSLTAFEAALSARVGVAHAIGVSSGLSAFALLLQALRLEGEVVVPAYIFPPVLQTLLAHGLVPRPVDIDSDSWNLDPAAAEYAVGPRTCAILAVHTSGFPAPAPALESLAARRRVALVFDAAHALGARVGDRAVGALGIAEVFSFTPSKMVSAGEGGAVTTADARIADDIAMGRNYGRSRSGDWTGRGLSARLGEIPALVARVGIDGLDREIGRRARLAAAYHEGLVTVPGVRFQSALRGTEAVHRDVSIRIDAAEFGLGRDAFRAVLAAEGVETGAFFHPAVPDLPLARHFLTASADGGALRAAFPVARAVAAEVVNLPIGGDIEPGTASEIASVIAAVQTNASRIAVRFRTTSAPRPPSSTLP